MLLCLKFQMVSYIVRAQLRTKDFLQRIDEFLMPFMIQPFEISTSQNDDFFRMRFKP